MRWIGRWPNNRAIGSNDLPATPGDPSAAHPTRLQSQRCAPCGAGFLDWMRSGLRPCRLERGLVDLVLEPPISGVPPRPARMVLNRRRRRLQKGVEPLLYGSVTFTRCLFQAGTIFDLYRPPAVADETGGLHRLRGKRHRFPVGTQHMSQKFVRV